MSTIEQTITKRIAFGRNPTLVEFITGVAKAQAEMFAGYDVVADTLFLSRDMYWYFAGLRGEVPTTMGQIQIKVVHTFGDRRVVLGRDGDFDAAPLNRADRRALRRAIGGTG